MTTQLMRATALSLTAAITSSALLNAYPDNPLYCHSSSRPSTDGTLAALIGGIAALATGAIIYTYCTRDKKTLDKAQKYINQSVDEFAECHEAINIIQDTHKLVILTSSHPEAKKYRKIIHAAIDRLDKLETKANTYHTDLQSCKSSYSTCDGFYQAATAAQQELVSLSSRALHTRAALMIGSSLITTSQLTDSLATYGTHIESLFNKPLSCHTNTQELSYVLSGMDNLKKFWLSLDDAVKGLSAKAQQISQELTDMKNSISGLGTHQLPSALRYAHEQHYSALQHCFAYINNLVYRLQEVQYATGRHSRYAYDNELYLADYTARLTQENGHLKDKISELNRVINNLEQEKRSLYNQISSLKDSIQSLQWQVSVANMRPTQPQVIITQQR